MKNAFKIAKKILAGDLNDAWVVTSQDPFETGRVALKIKNKYKIPLQVQIHADFLNPYFGKESILNKIRVIIARKAIKKADCIRVVSKRIGNSIENKYKLKIKPINIPIFTDIEKIESFEPKFNLKEKYSQFNFIILMNSRLENVKNIELAIHAFKEVLEKAKSVGLIIVGDGSKRSKYENLVKELSLENKVIFEGWQEDTLSYYKGADLFINTSNHEGYCLSLIEAAASVCPIITTDVGVVGGVLNESNVFVCPVGDQKCIEKKIINVINNQEILGNLSEKAFQDIKKSLPSNKTEYLEMHKNIFEECLKDSK